MSKNSAFVEVKHKTIRFFFKLKGEECGDSETGYIPTAAWKLKERDRFYVYKTQSIYGPVGGPYARDEMEEIK